MGFPERIPDVVDEQRREWRIDDNGMPDLLRVHVRVKPANGETRFDAHRADSGITP